MKKFVLSLSLVICFIILDSCTYNKNDSITENAEYNGQTNMLKIDFTNKPDTSLLQIIAYSNIQKSGYGVLLNIENSYSKSDLDALKLKFQKLDINAIHNYNISLRDTLELKTRVAMKGAKFVWLLGNVNNDWPSKPVGQFISNLKSSEEDRVLIVLD